MRKTRKIIALLLAVITILSVCALTASALPMGYPMDTYIYYKDESGNTLATAYHTSVNAVEPSLNVASPTISGYYLKNSSDATVTWDMMNKTFPASNYVRHGSAYYTVVYTKACTFTAYYLYSNGRQIHTPISQTGKSGNAYRIPSPSIAGYTPDKTVVSGRYAVESDSATVHYYPIVYTLTYNANGGTGAPASSNISYGIGCGLSYTKPTRTGYTFLGWSTSSMATTEEYQAGGFFDKAYSNATLYAVWSPHEYTVSYNANGGSGAPASQTKTEGITLTLSTVTPTRYKYDFMGWSTSSTATSASYFVASNFTTDANTTLYAVWSYIPDTYTVTYSANGGSGAPAAQTKAENYTLTLSTVKPTKDGSTFLGWALSSDATTAVYQAGGSFTANADTTLYAVWQNDSYDFSVSDLSVTPNKVFQYDAVTVKFRVDSWDRYNSYENIPVEVILNNSVIYTGSVNFSAYGVSYVTFTLNVGSLEGIQTLTAHVNWNNHNNESRTTNNSTSGTFTVEKKMEFSALPITVNPDHVAGNEVISSFYVANESATAVTPDTGLNFDFEVYYLDGSNEISVIKQTWSNVVIPANSTNLVYFKWTVPTDKVGTLLWCKGTVNSNGAIKEGNSDNNTTFFTVTVKSKTESSQTPNTWYESTAPNDYAKVSSPTASAGSATWNMWEYANGQFTLKTYGIRMTADNPTVTPSSACKTATYFSGKWSMKSGYGITLDWKPMLTSIGGYAMPDSNAYTNAQNVFATFPEYRYLTEDGKYRTLENVGGVYQFVQNTDADGNERIHFIPVYVGDGDYTVSVTATQIWTPAGMITATRNANAVTIDGTIYDDFYVGN